MPYGGGQFVAVANACQGDDCVMTSPDGISWTLLTGVPHKDDSWNAVAFGDGHFVAVKTNTGVMSSMCEGRS